MIDERFSRTALLLGEDALERLSKARVAVFGAGGVGGYVIEALARSAVGALDIIDGDRVSVSNLNRQIIALESTVGQFKAETAKQRVLQINPEIKVNAVNEYFTPENSYLFDFSQYDYVVDAVDMVAAKIELVLRAQSAGTKIISSMGAGNKLDPTAFEVEDIFKTSVCPLARVMRYELKKRGVKRLKVVYSKEPPIKTGVKDETTGKSVPGSAAFVPSAAGLVIAAEVVKDICGVNG